MYMFQCCSLHSSHPLLPPLYPKVFSLHLCLHFCPANRFIHTTFLDSLYIDVLVYDIYLSLSHLLRSVQLWATLSTTLPAWHLSYTGFHPFSYHHGSLCILFLFSHIIFPKWNSQTITNLPNLPLFY